MSLDWLANTTSGRFVGEYVSTPFTSDGLAHSVVPVAKPPGGALFDQAIYTPTGGLSVGGGTAPATSRGVVFTGTTAAQHDPEP